MSLRFSDRREDQRQSTVLVKQMADKIVDMEALHDDDDGVVALLSRR